MKSATCWSAVLLACAVVFVAGCAGMQQNRKPSLYERLGGKPAIQAVVDDFIGNVAADNRINARFANTDIPRLKENLVNQICAGAGGKCVYAGRDMKSAHAGMNVTEAEFGALVEDLVKTLDKLKVPAAEKNELLAILGPMKKDIVGAVAMQQSAISAIPYPKGYRAWYHVKSRVNLEGHSLAANVGYQHVYANDKAQAGLASGRYADGATFVLDRMNITKADDQIMLEGTRKVLLVMVKDDARFAATGGWGFEAFKGGDAQQRVVKDGGGKCFTCHAPLAKDGFVFSKPRG